jgi:hypothetical protein
MIMFQNIIGTCGTNLMSNRTLKSDIISELLLFLSFWNELNCSQIYIIMKNNYWHLNYIYSNIIWDFFWHE